MQMGSKRKLEQKSPYHKIYLKEDYKRYSRTLHMIKGSVQEEDNNIVNIYAANIGANRYIRQTLTDIKGEIGSNTLIVGDFNTPLTPMDSSSKQKINNETQVLNDTH